MGLRAILALVPVLLFLLVLIRLDSFRLVRLRRVAVSLLVGAACAALSYILNNGLLDLVSLPLAVFAVVVAPLVEEGLKASFLGWLVATRRTGFLVDAVIHGFATGAGFALVENLYYLKHLADADLLVWLVRGLGTAVMHGGATAIFAIIVAGFERRSGGRRRYPWSLAFASAVLLHAGFNRFMDHPLLVTGAILFLLPLILRWTYRVGERRLRGWLGRGFDQDVELLGLIQKGEVDSSPLGRYLGSLKQQFRPDTVVDMLCLLRLQAELNIVVRGRLILGQHGLKPNLPEGISEKLEEVRYLENRIGRTGLLALRPVGRWEGRHPWQRRSLEDLAGD